MPVVGLGTWKSPKGEVEAGVRHALCEAGYRHIDAAQIYQNQPEVGRGIQHALRRCNLSRTDLWVTSKVWNVDFQNVSAAADTVLRELGLGYIDQLLLHWPTPYEKPPLGCPPACPERFGGTDDPQRPRGPDGKLVHSDVPLSKTWQDMEGVRASGRARSIGVSNFLPEEVDGLLLSERSIVPAVNQVEAHLFWNQHRLRKAMHKRGIQLVAYSPLANPGLHGHEKVEGMRQEVVQGIAEKTQLAPAQVMLSYLIFLGDVVIPKSVTKDRITANIDFRLALDYHDIGKLSAITPQKRLSNPANRPGGRHVFEDPEVHVRKRVRAVEL